MILIDIVVWMAVAKVALLLLEDAAYNVVRGKPSPRQRERAQHRAAEAAGQPRAKPSGGWGRTRAAVGGYLAGVVEDATAAARARKRRAQAHRRGDRAVDGVFVDFDESGDGFYADCDVCAWSSRRFRIEANALAAGREHTRTEHPEQYHEEDPQPEPQQGDGSEEDREEPQPDRRQPDSPDDHEEPQPDRQQPDSPDDHEEPQPDRQQPDSPDDHEEPQPEPQQPDSSGDREEPQPDRQQADGSRSSAGTHGWECDSCGTRREGFASEADARKDAAGHLCAPRHTSPDDPASGGVWGCQYPVAGADSGRCGDQARDGLRYCPPHLEVVRAEGRRRCMVPDPGHGHGVCGLYAVPGTNFCVGHQGSDLPVTALADDDPRWRCPFPTASGPCGAAAQFNDLYCTQHDGLDQATQTPGAGNPAGAGKERNSTVNLEASGPDEIRAAFTAAADDTTEKAEEIADLASVLTVAADQFEQNEMAGSTVGLVREAAAAMTAALGQLDVAKEQLEAALADFNSKDGHVADTVADTGGNLASREVLVGA